MTKNKKKRTRLSPEERKNALLIATRSELEEKGFRNLTVPGIVKAAGVSQGTFYYYFRSVDHVFLTLFYRTVAPPLMDASAKMDFSNVEKSENLEEVLFRWYEVLGNQLIEHATIIREAFFVAPHSDTQAGQEIAGFIEGMRLWRKKLLDNANGKKIFREIDSEIVSHAVIGIVIGATLQASKHELNVRKWAREMAKLETFGLSNSSESD